MIMMIGISSRIIIVTWCEVILCLSRIWFISSILYALSTSPRNKYGEAKSQVTGMWNQALIYSDMPAKIEAIKR